MAVAKAVTFDGRSVMTKTIRYTMVVGATTTPPTLGAAGSVNTTYKRVDDLCYVTGTLRQSASGTNGAGVYLFPLPAGLNADSQKIYIVNVATNDTCYGNVGGATACAPGAAGRPGIIRMYDTRNMVIHVHDVGGGDHLVPISNTAFGLGTAGRVYSWWAWVPIEGW